MRSSLLILLFIATAGFSAEKATTTELDLSLITNCDTLPEKGNFSAGILFNLKPDWHLYWRNPGDTGLAPKIKWQLPNTISSDEIQWPYPHLITTDSIYNFGYSNSLLLPVSMQTQNLNQDKIELAATVEWLVCKDICIPGKAELRKTFNTADSCQNNTHEKLFTEWQKRIPETANLLDGSARLVNNQFQLELYFTQPVFRNAKAIDIFIEDSQVVSYQPVNSSRWKHNWMQWTQEKNESFSKLPSTINAVIVVDHQQSYKIQLSTSEK
jgi:DsbC/DsbD-like thiol-disulfide interchange protein